MSSAQKQLKKALKEIERLKAKVAKKAKQILKLQKQKPWKK